MLWYLNIYAGDKLIIDKYCISVKGKKRYIVPLVQVNGKVARIDDIDDSCKEAVRQYKNLTRSKYTGFGFEFKPYSFENTIKDELS